MRPVSSAIIARNGRTVLTITGELDLATANWLRETINMLVRSGRGRIEIDLSRVTFLDSTIIGVLVAGRQEAEDLAKPYQVTGAHDTVRYVLNTAGVLDYLTRGQPNEGARPPTDG